MDDKVEALDRVEYMKVMVLWSGGVESTSLMKYLLTETDAEVHAHYIKMTNPEGRLPFEQHAITQLIPQLWSIRSFEYSESSINICDGKGLPWDYTLHYGIGAAAMEVQNCERLYRAGCVEDEWIHMRYGDELSMKRFGSQWGDLHNHRASILTHTLGIGRTPAQVAPWLPFYEHSKGWHIRYLGDLFEHTWSCRRPINGHRCNKCHSCYEVASGLCGTSANPEVAEMIEQGIIT